jgi:tRNA-2-methylthio-N6-dimethylallyladenosine synthase
MALSTDILVGFPGEDLEDHRATLALMARVGFHSAFMFRYSARPGTRAAGLPDDVPEEEKTRRLREVIDAQNSAIDRMKQDLLGTDVEVLIEGPGGRDPGFMIGRTRKNWLAKLPAESVRMGETVVARVTAASRWMLTCELREKGGNEK